MVSANPNHIRKLSAKSEHHGTYRFFVQSGRAQQRAPHLGAARLVDEIGQRWLVSAGAGVRDESASTVDVVATRDHPPHDDSPPPRGSGHQVVVHRRPREHAAFPRPVEFHRGPQKRGSLVGRHAEASDDDLQNRVLVQLFDGHTI